jgi:hypothetical protein
MNQMNYKEALETLRKAGFTASEIDRLYRLCRDYAENEMDRAPANLHRLEFVRWLVVTGKLTDQIV